MDLDNGKLFICRHVCFDETIYHLLFVLYVQVVPMVSSSPWGVGTICSRWLPTSPTHYATSLVCSSLCGSAIALPSSLAESFTATDYVMCVVAPSLAVSP